MERVPIDWLLKKPIAHRGLHNTLDRIPENSMIAFEKAVAGAFPIELDVQVIADQEVVVFHDETLERLCNRKRATSSLTRKDLPLYKLANTDYTIPLLRDVLKLVDGKVPLLIEIKRQPDIERANLIILNTLLGYDGQFAIQSFDPFILRWFAKNAPLLPRGQLASSFKDESISSFKKWVLKNLWLNVFSQPHFITYNIEGLPNGLISRNRSRGLKIIGWTVYNEQDYKRVVPYCDNVIFENLQSVLIK